MEQARIKRARRPKNSMDMDEWSNAVCSVLGTSKAAPDAIAMFR